MRTLLRPALLVMAGAMVLVGLQMAFFPQLSLLRGKGFDLYQTLLPLDEAAPGVRLVTIDDEALAQVGRWPWPRTQIARIIDAISDAAPAALAIDILFPEESNPAEDRILANAIRASGAVLAMSAGDFGNTGEPPRIAGWSVIGDPVSLPPPLPGLLSPAPIFAGAAGGLGIVRATPDGDGVTRSVALAWATGDTQAPVFHPAFSMEIVRQLLGTQSYTLRLGEDGYDAIRTGSLIAPLSGGGAVWLVDAPGPVEHVPALAVLDGSRSGELTDRIVILSVSAAGFDAFHTTPLHATRPGAEVHALLTTQILAGLFPFEPGHAPFAERVIFLLLAVAAALLPALLGRHPVALAAGYALIIAAPLALGLAAYAWRSELYEPLQPMAGLFLLVGTDTFRRYRESEKRRERISGQFARYLPPEVVNELIRTGADVEPKANRREVTVLLMDMRGFTAASTALPPEEIEATVNRFFTLASEEIFRTRGTIDKFMGDAVMAFWNAPLDQADHPNLALDAVEAIFERLEVENRDRKRDGKMLIRVGAGLEAGICSVGNFGSDLRYTYTVIGEAANMAARLEMVTKTRPFPVLAGPGLASRTEGRLIPVGSVTIAGYENAVEVFTLESLKT